jgi:hypothetical protein
MSSLNRSLGDKNLVISAPHIGSSRFLSKTISCIAQDIGSDLLVLDYQSISSSIKELKRSGQSLVEKSVEIAIPEFSKPFTPGLYHIYDHEAEDDEFDEGEEGDDEDYNDSGTLGSFTDLSKINTNATKLFVNLNVLPDHSKKNDAITKQENGSAGFLISNISVHAGKDEKKLNSVALNQTPFDESFSDSDIEMFKSFIFSIIEKKYRGGNSLIIYLNDLTDIIEASNNNSGKKLVIELSNMTKKLKDAGCSVSFVAGSYPSMLDTKNLNQGNEFYSHILDGNFFTYGPNGERQYIALDGALFKTTVDNLPDYFEKIPILPPSFVYLSMQKSLNPLNATKVLKDESLHYQNQLNKYLSQLEFDLKYRIGLINRSTLLKVCQDHGIVIHYTLSLLMKRGLRVVLGRRKNPELEQLFNHLTSRIWEYDKIRRLVFLAVGSRLESIKEKTNSMEINAESLIDALGILYETDISRFSSMSQADIDEMRAVIPSSEPSLLPKSSVEPVNDATHRRQNNTLEDLTLKFKKEGIKLNQYEKKLLGTIINPGIFRLIQIIFQSVLAIWCFLQKPSFCCKLW